MMILVALSCCCWSIKLNDFRESAGGRSRAVDADAVRDGIDVFNREEILLVLVLVLARRRLNRRRFRVHFFVQFAQQEIDSFRSVWERSFRGFRGVIPSFSGISRFHFLASLFRRSKHRFGFLKRREIVRSENARHFPRVFFVFSNETVLAFQHERAAGLEL